MKHTKDRVIAIDYFRGLCILMILLSHSVAFSRPFAYLSGLGNLWVSAAEIFFLLSGITLGIVRAQAIGIDFKAVLYKSWKRAGFLYALHILMVCLSLLLAYTFIANGWSNDVVGVLPQASGRHLLAQICSLFYSMGWAIFLMYYAVFMLLAPFALYILRTRFWAVVPILSTLIYVLNSPYPLHILSTGPYSWIANWQVYFFLGLTIARFRVAIISWFYALPTVTTKYLSNLVVASTAIALMVSALVGFSLGPLINTLSLDGWLPLKLNAAYTHLLDFKPQIDNLLMNSRTGILRPLASLLFLAAAYLLYQKYKQPILSRTGRFVNAMGRDTLWIFVAQAFAIPLLAAMPLQRNLFNNLLLSGSLILIMWLLTKRRVVMPALRNYTAELKASYEAGKYNYLYRSENDA
ncbi:OpgC domain-containing protein [Candidatus Saccharibacteria bacterium]|nr:OpgC domain-containing protein [Candidatus Saccharibacteria bacterium]